MAVAQSNLTAKKERTNFPEELWGRRSVGPMGRFILEKNMRLKWTRQMQASFNRMVKDLQKIKQVLTRSLQAKGL
jgi:hypothetical protein